ncbi:hypothetical protein N7532_002599 [Penicillium argentinense]|uniref:Adenylylsulfate kinase n=1 Tax=Penicillium argentinense TaxID=1131581 RepID=A0A9W9G0Q0_9EURO|nr:uncharacterized protein N7532_002599 [Penicillium argentinense]KAJ5109954.1 hypothetical protein N7532_002599 [Penicillium argentinense]
MKPAKPTPLVWINGFPGSGKLTVTKFIAQLNPDTLILDNHTLIDPVEAKFPPLHPDYLKERHLYRQAILKKHVYDEATIDKLVIFTGMYLKSQVQCMAGVAYAILDFQSDNELGRDVATEYKDAAHESGRPFLPVYLVCDVDANLERVSTLERIDSGTKKLTNAQLVKHLRGKCDLFRFDDCPGLELDTTNAPPLEIASKILDFVENSRSSF